MLLTSRTSDYAARALYLQVITTTPQYILCQTMYGRLQVLSLHCEKSRTLSSLCQLRFILQKGSSFQYDFLCRFVWKNLKYSIIQKPTWHKVLLQAIAYINKKDTWKYIVQTGTYLSTLMLSVIKIRSYFHMLSVSFEHRCKLFAAVRAIVCSHIIVLYTISMKQNNLVECLSYHMHEYKLYREWIGLLEKQIAYFYNHQQGFTKRIH